MSGMRKKVLIHGGIGFLVGMVLVMLIPAISNLAEDGTARLVSSSLIARVGSAQAAFVMSLLMYGLYGSCCLGGMLLYEIERWPLALATAVHYLGIALGYWLVSLLLCWELTWRELLFIEGLMAVGFVLIWLVLYLRYKAEVRELNHLNEMEQRFQPDDTCQR